MTSGDVGDCASERAAEGVEHLQAAAREMLAAARSFLDAIEDVVSDRDKMTAVVEVVADAVESIGRSVSAMAGEAKDGTTGSSTRSPSATPGSSRVRRVVVE